MFEKFPWESSPFPEAGCASGTTSSPSTTAMTTAATKGRKVAQSGVNTADKNFGPAGAPPARPRGALATSPIAPHPRSRPWGSFNESVRGAAFKSKCVTQVLNLRRGPPRAKNTQFRRFTAPTRARSPAAPTPTSASCAPSTACTCTLGRGRASRRTPSTAPPPDEVPSGRYRRSRRRGARKLARTFPENRDDSRRNRDEFL